MARIGAAPETHHTLPQDFATELGRCVADFGWLEEILKRTIYALERARLADDLTEAELRAWLSKIQGIADDSMGTLIEQMDAAMRRHPGLRDRSRITDRLAELRLWRNLLCHASWRPTEVPTLWHPAFVSLRGEVQQKALSLEDLRHIRAQVAEIGERVLRVMRTTGIQGEWAGDEPS
ncbi:MAG: hypothetical protein QM682_07435 [Paracoccus sp. (in: a-proteobacteria)]|uniref:hypothetical protein n=1 Tax=Paracoccus sp. TaxID=267 RepID=UPI0039E24647